MLIFQGAEVVQKNLTHETQQKAEARDEQDLVAVGQDEEETDEEDAEDEEEEGDGSTEDEVP